MYIGRWTAILFIAASALAISARAEEVNAEKLLIHVDFGKRELFLYRGAEVVAKFPVAIPRRLPRQPVEGVVRQVIRNPWWSPTEPTRNAYFRKYGIELPKHIPPGDPKNAMGVGKIVITFTTPGANQSVRIHGTNTPSQIGMRISRGCIRLYNEDWELLANLITGRETHVLLN